MFQSKPYYPGWSCQNSLLCGQHDRHLDTTMTFHFILLRLRLSNHIFIANNPSSCLSVPRISLSYTEDLFAIETYYLKQHAWRFFRTGLQKNVSWEDFDLPHKTMVLTPFAWLHDLSTPRQFHVAHHTSWVPGLYRITLRTQPSGPQSVTMIPNYLRFFFSELMEIGLLPHAQLGGNLLRVAYSSAIFLHSTSGYLLLLDRDRRWSIEIDTLPSNGFFESPF